MARKSTKLKEAEEVLSFLKCKRLRIVADQIKATTYAVCIMETEDSNDNRIMKTISPYYMKPTELIAFIWGLYIGGYKKFLETYC